MRKLDFHVKESTKDGFAAKTAKAASVISGILRQFQRALEEETMAETRKDEWLHADRPWP